MSFSAEAPPPQTVAAEEDIAARDPLPLTVAAEEDLTPGETVTRSRPQAAEANWTS